MASTHSHEPPHAGRLPSQLAIRTEFLTLFPEIQSADSKYQLPDGEGIYSWASDILAPFLDYQFFTARSELLTRLGQVTDRLLALEDRDVLNFVKCEIFDYVIGRDASTFFGSTLGEQARVDFENYQRYWRGPSR